MPSKTVCALLAAAAVAMVAASPAAGPAPSAPSAAAAARPDVHQLVRELGDKDYFVRERAQADLAALGFEAFDVLSDATASDDPEVAVRARYLLRQLRVEWAAHDDPPEVRQLLQDYDTKGADERQTQMHQLAVLPGQSGIAALCRLVRYEKSALLSKQAAIEVLAAVKPGAEPDKKLVETLRKSLGKSRRAGAEWLLTFARFAEEPAVAAAPWSKLVEAEESLLQKASEATTSDIVAALLRFQAARLKKIGRNDEAIAALRRLIALEKGDTQTLLELLQWLTAQKAWKVVEETADRFGPLIAGNADLSYAVAEAQLAQDKKDRAEQLAARALGMDPGKDPQALGAHYLRALRLQNRGLFAWAGREYRQVMAAGPNGPLTVSAALRLAEMNHDQGDDLVGAELLEKAIRAVGKLPGVPPANGMAEIRAQMNYFFACHWEKKGDRAKSRQYLEKALADNPSDLDVLIACYRLPGQTPEFHQKITRLVRDEVQVLRERIEEANNEEKTDENENEVVASNYNQFAWLVANTEGDLDEALKASQKSLELSPDNGGYYDTLGRVYFARGDYQKAVSFQTKAVELEPHMGLVRRQLELFRHKLAEKGQKK
jgi:tetratricopeptide (TPR) repeat protein